MKAPSGVPHASWHAIAAAVALIAATLGGPPAIAAGARDAGIGAPVAMRPNALLTIDQNRVTVVDRIVGEWGDALANSGAGLTKDQLRAVLAEMRADHLLAASLAGSLDGLRNVLANSLTTSAPVAAGLLQAKALGDAGDDLAYTPVTPCRLVDTRGSFAAVYQGDGTPAHTASPFGGNEIRNYAQASGNGACLTQLPAGLNPAAVQLQVFGIPVNGGASGDIEILPQGAVFGGTATLVYVGSVPFTSASTTARVNLASNQIGVQVRGGGAHVAIDVVGYFRAPEPADGTTSNVADGAITKPKLAAPGGTNGQVLTTDGTQLVWQTLPQFARWEGHVETIFGGNASLWVFAGGTATVTIPPGPSRRLTAYGAAAMALSSGAQLAQVNICFQKQSGTGTVHEFNPVSFLLLEFTTSPTNYTAGDTVVLPSGTYNVGVCVNNNQGPLAIDANNWSRGWVMVTPN